MQEREQIYCIFNETKEKIDKKIEKAFEIYLRELANKNINRLK